MNLRAIAATIIDDVSQGASLSDALDPALETIKDPRDRALVQAISFGVCRFYFQLDFILSELLERPMKEKDSDIHSLLFVGLYQLIHMRIPEHAAVSETVNAVEAFKKPWARGLVNATLREYLRRKTDWQEIMKEDEEAYYAHPDWLIKKLKDAYPDSWESILAHNNEHPPFSLRVNAPRISREEYLEKVEGSAIPETASGIILTEATVVDALPGFREGDVTVQDGAAQLAAKWLDVKNGHQVLDACSAPGGKLTHILELAPLAKVTALEKDKHRLKQINENLARLNQKAHVICVDAANVKSWWNEILFDRILLDAPCTATGVIRRHPDIKLLREETDIRPLVIEQKSLLHGLWQVLKSGGKLLYATCSLLPEENHLQIESFLKTHPDATLLPLPNQIGVGRQILPGENQMDGFYYALIQKKQ